MPFYEEKNFSQFQHRRDQLLDAVKGKFPATTVGGILLLGDFENDRVRFRQDSTFYYYTGIEEPGAALWIDLSGEVTLYLPDYKGGRSQWVAASDDLNKGNAERFGFDAIDFLGKPCAGYQCFTFFQADEYAYLIKKLANVVRTDGTIFTTNPLSGQWYAQQKSLLQHLNAHLRHVETYEVDLLKAAADISPIIAMMRRQKDPREIELMYQAVAMTAMAHEGAATMIAPDTPEYHVQAGIEFIFTESGGSAAFPSIVASGPNSTILHYTLNNRTIEKDDVVLVDIGAEYNYYCGDISRTYPASGTFTKRQREIYSLVLEAQEYIAEIARPGMWLNNKEHSDQSLHHLARDYFEKHGEYAQYFVHSIGHFLGLDVHDVGDQSEPLQDGDVFTIEPGLYIPREQLGVRIEDNYWMTKKGPVCLSDELPKTADEIQDMMRKKLE